MTSRYATARELGRILESSAADLCQAIGLGFLQMSLPVDSSGRAQAFIEVQVAPNQADRLPQEVSLELRGEKLRVRLQAVSPVERYVPLRSRP